MSACRKPLACEKNDRLLGSRLGDVLFAGLRVLGVTEGAARLAIEEWLSQLKGGTMTVGLTTQELCDAINAAISSGVILFEMEFPGDGTDTGEILNGSASVGKVLDPEREVINISVVQVGGV